MFGDVTKERRLKRALSYQASHDALTGLINRREFDTRLETAVSAAQRGEAEYVLLYVDLDQFKVVNDTCGHSAGDRLLGRFHGPLARDPWATSGVAEPMAGAESIERAPTPATPATTATTDTTATTETTG